MAGKKKRKKGGEVKLRETPLEDLLAMLGDETAAAAGKKEARRELQRRKTKGEKFDIPQEHSSTAAGTAAPPGRDEEVRCWMTGHVNGFTGQIIGCVFAGAAGIRSLIVVYVLDPVRIMRAGFNEESSIRKFKEALAAISGSPDGYVSVDPAFALGRIRKILDAVDESNQEWEGNRGRAMGLLDRAAGRLKPGGVSPETQQVEPSEEVAAGVSSDSGFLRKRDAFHLWRPETQTLKVLVEKLNVVSGGKISTSNESKMAAMEAIILREVDAYFDRERRANMAAALMDNAFVAGRRKDRVFAEQCAALSRLVEDASKEPHEIRFLVECMRSGIIVNEPAQQARAPAAQQGSIIIPGGGHQRPAADTQSGREKGEDSFLIKPSSLIEKP
ncbi:MAG: hypothetical protein ABIJ56_04110 [Pseudomonadota bacterium]